MLKKIFISISIFLFSNIIHAETCQTPADLKAGLFNQWRAIDIDSGLPATKDEIKKFQQQVKNFKLAEWMEEAPEGTAHCYYAGEEKYLNVYLAKFNLVPTKTSLWKFHGKDVAQCSEGLDGCEFMAG